MNGLWKKAAYLSASLSAAGLLAGALIFWFSCLYWFQLLQFLGCRMGRLTYPLRRRFGHWLDGKAKPVLSVHMWA